MKKLLVTALLTALVSPFAFAKTPIVAQYFGIWTEPGQKWEQKFREDTPFTKLNRLYVSFGRIERGSDGHFTIAFDGDPQHAVAIMDRMRQVNPTADLFLALGGDGSNNAFGGAAKDPQFAQNALKFLTRYGFNGLDIDWEMGLDKQNLNQVITNLYTVLHENNLQLTLDVWPFVHNAYDMPVLREHLDQINIMSYGRFMSLDYCANSYIQAGFPAEKIIGGIETETNYNAGVDTLGENGSIVAKANFAKSHHLAGMMGWRLDNDYTSKEDVTWPKYEGALTLWDVMNK